MNEFRRSLAAYLVAMAGCAASLAFILGIRHADLSRPLAYGRDAICTQLWAKGVIENGWYLTNPSLGAPGRMEMHDFPLSDSLFFLGLKVVSLATTSYPVALNTYYFLTYFLITISALAVLRHLAVPRGPAVVGALLYAFLPYHYQRGEQHLFLASYFLVPPAILMCLWLIRDGAILFRPREAGRGVRLDLTGRRSVASLGVCALLGSGGVYYAFFTCYLLAVAAFCAAWKRRRTYPLANAAVLITVIAAGVAANVAPKVAYAMEHGPNPAAIRRSGLEFQGLRISRMLLPIIGHRIPTLDRLRFALDETLGHHFWECSTTALGLVGGVGLLILIGALFVGRRRGASGPIAGLVALNLAALLLAMPDGIGAMFCLYVTPLIRCYNRMVVFVGFFSIAAVAVLVGRSYRSIRPGAPRWLARAALGAAAVLGLMDQNSELFIPEYEHSRRQFNNDAEFVSRVEAALPPGSMVFQLPLEEFPEGHGPGKMGIYDHARPYLHSKALRWSFGAMKGREVDSWQKYVRELAPAEMLRTLALAGFSGVYLDRAGDEGPDSKVESDLAKLMGVPPIVSRDRRFVVYDLVPLATALREELGPERWESGRELALKPVVASWEGGFYGREEGADGLSWHWCNGDGTLRLSNPWPVPRRVELSMSLGTFVPEPTTVRIEGPSGTIERPAATTSPAFKTTLDVPSGGTSLRFLSDGVRARAAEDNRSLVFSVAKFRVTLAEGAQTPEPVSVGWGDGFSYEEREGDHAWRWSSGDGTIRLTNEWLIPRRIDLAMDLATLAPGGAPVRLGGPGGGIEYLADEKGRAVATSLIVGPGVTTLRISGGKPIVPEREERTLAFRVADLRATALPVESDDPHPATVRVDEGFYGREEGPEGLWWHWSAGEGRIRIENGWLQPRRVDLSMSLGTYATEATTVRIEGPDGTAEYPADSVGRDLRAAFDVPPGGTTLRLTSPGRRVELPGDPRSLTFRVARPRLDRPGPRDERTASGPADGAPARR